MSAATGMPRPTDVPDFTTDLATEFERTFRTIFKRCVQCPSTTPSCPSCSSNEICSLIPQSCDACAHMTCVVDPSASSNSGGPNIGAIAGGVIGGVVFMAVVMFFLWRFWIKKRREQQELEAEEWPEDDIVAQKSQHRFTQMRTDAASTRTRASLANSILSRASNIIQIAYIPGVTNRNGSSHNSLAPVPPIPAAYSDSPKSPLSNEGDALFFRPESTWSASSSVRSANRDTQYTRQSITPSLARSSMFSEVYRDSAASDAMPAVPAARAVPRMVSVKPSQAPSANEVSAPGSVKAVAPGEGSSNLSRGAGSFGKASQVTIGGKGKGRFPVRFQGHGSSPLAETADSETEDEDEHARARRSLLRGSGQNERSRLSAHSIESPFFDASESIPAAASSLRIPPPPAPYSTLSSSIGQDLTSRRAFGGLSAVIEEATKRASAVPSSTALGKRDESPFGDEYATD